MKTFEELNSKEKGKQISYELTRSRLENIVNTDLITAFIFLTIVMLIVASILGYGLTIAMGAETEGSFITGLQIIRASMIAGVVSFCLFIALLTIVIYKRDQFKKRLFAVYEIDEDLFKVKKEDLMKVKRTWKKEKGD